MFNSFYRVDSIRVGARCKKRPYTSQETRGNTSCDYGSRTRVKRGDIELPLQAAPGMITFNIDPQTVVIVFQTSPWKPEALANRNLGGTDGVESIDQT